MDKFPAEIYPRFCWSPAESATLRITCRAIFSLIPGNLFVKTAENRWESDYYYVQIIPSEMSTQFINQITSDENGVSGDSEVIPAKYSAKFMYRYNNKFTPFNYSVARWTVFIPELRENIYKRFTSTVGGGTLDPYDVIGKPSSNNQTGIVWFVNSITICENTYRLLYGDFRDMIKLASSHHAVTIYKRLDVYYNFYRIRKN